MPVPILLALAVVAVVMSLAHAYKPGDVPLWPSVFLVALVLVALLWSGGVKQ